MIVYIFPLQKSILAMENPSLLQTMFLWKAPFLRWNSQPCLTTPFRVARSPEILLPIPPPHCPLDARTKSLESDVARFLAPAGLGSIVTRLPTTMSSNMAGKSLNEICIKVFNFPLSDDTGEYS